MKVISMCFYLIVAVSSVCVTSCATKDAPSDHHDEAVRKIADQEFDNRLAY